MPSGWKELVAQWCKDGPVTATKTGLRYTDGDAAVDIAVEETTADQVTLSTKWAAPKWMASPDLGIGLDELARAARSAGGVLLSAAGSGEGVVLTMPLYLEGLSRQSFVEAVAGVARAHVSLEAMATELDANRKELVAAEQLVAEMDTTSSPTEPIAAAAAPVTTPVTEPLPVAWVPTHRAPQLGMDAGAKPEPGDPIAARLDPWLEVKVTERLDDWAHIECSNGWTAWVDGRLLQAI